MASVSAKFKDDFDYWSAAKIESGEFSVQDMAELKNMVRKDLTEGPDQLREGLTVITAAGVEVPAMIDDHKERYQLWGDFFASECAQMRRWRLAA